MSKKSENQGLIRRRDDYIVVFGSDAGRRVLSDLMSQFNIGKSSHIPNDSHETAFREGERHVVLHILSHISKRTDPDWLNERLDHGEIEYSTVQEFS